MAFELVIVVCVGLAAAGLLMAITRPFGLKLGKTVAPAVAALAMVGYQVWSRYSWEDRITATLSADEVVVLKMPMHTVYEPWSYVFPITGGLVVLDKRLTMTHPDHPDLRVVTTRLYEQGQKSLEMAQFVDCPGRRRAPAVDGGAAGMLPPDAVWISGGEPAALYAQVCGG